MRYPKETVKWQEKEALARPVEKTEEPMCTDCFKCGLPHSFIDTETYYILKPFIKVPGMELLRLCLNDIFENLDFFVFVVGFSLYDHHKLKTYKYFDNSVGEHGKAIISLK